MIPNCAATRHIHFTLDGSGPAVLTPPALDQWPDISWEPDDKVQRVNLNTVTRAEVASWQPGDTLLLSGKMLTGRDTAHKRLVEMLTRGEPLPVNLQDRFIYYVGPVDPYATKSSAPPAPPPPPVWTNSPPPCWQKPACWV